MPSLLDVVAAFAARDPDRLAIITEQDGERTYGELTERGVAVGLALRQGLGIEPGERVCIWAANRPEWLETYLGAGAVGVPTVAANPEWTDHEAGYVFEHSEAVAVVCDVALAERALRLAADRPRLRHVVALADEGVARPAGTLAYDEVIAPHLGAGLADLPSGERPPGAFIMYTSGTSTGRPKAVLSKPSTTTAAVNYEEMFGLTSADRGIVVTPFFHGNGFGGALAPLSHGASVMFPRRFSARRFWSLVDRYRPTYMMTLAPIVNILLGQPPALHERTHAFRVLIVLGAARNATTIEERYGAPVIDWYGMTEAGMGTYTRPSDPRKPGSAGRPFPGSGMLIVGDDGAEVPVGQVGEVVFRREALTFDGYLNDDEANAAALDARYFRTGDLGYFDEDGYFFFVDRKKDIVRRGGENISSMEVEAVMRSHEQVAEAAVVGKPDPVLGERVAAFVVPAEGLAGPPDPDAIRRHVSEVLAPFKVPEDIVFVDELPRTGTGKVQKFQLRQQLA